MHRNTNCIREACKLHELISRIVFSIVSTEVANVICSWNSRAVANCPSDTLALPKVITYFDENLKETLVRRSLFVIALFSHWKISRNNLINRIEKRTLYIVIVCLILADFKPKGR